MTNLNIGIDIDGTVTDPYYWLPEANRVFGKNIASKDVTRYEIHKVMGISQKEYDDFYREYGASLHRDSQIRFGVKEVMDRLYTNHGIHFITAREDTMRGVSAEWLGRHEIRYDTLSLLGTHHKAQCAKEHECDLFIEDSLDNALELSSSGFEVLLVDCNYNKGDLPPNIRRMGNWLQIERYIESLAKRNEQLKLAI